jgi:myo-inositol 2-dehydrogenase/D-chiro-inositol 1-dehydrogenase
LARDGVRVGLLGCGRIGRMHAANLARHPRTTLAMVYDVRRPSAETVGAAEDAPVADSAEAVFDSDAVDAVLIATATETHAAYIEAAVAAGKPALCEKPIDLSLARVNACAERIGQGASRIQLGFNRRFDPGHRAARDAFRAGEIGDLHQLVITSRDPGMPSRAYYEQAGGLLRDMTIHDFDLARFMLPDEPVEVSAMVGRLNDPALMEELDDHDTAMVLLRTASGVQGVINNSRASTYGYDQRVELLGRRGMLLSGNRTAHGLRRYGGAAVEAAAPYLEFFIERYEAAFMAELDAFARCVESGEPPEVGFEDGRRALILAEAAYRSAGEGRAVRVDEIT